MMKSEDMAEEVGKVVALLLDEDRWCKRALARDKDGVQLFDAHDPLATQWCIYGAMYANKCSLDTSSYIQTMGKGYGWSDLDRLNDLNPHHYIIQFLHAALHGVGGYLTLKAPLELHYD